MSVDNEKNAIGGYSDDDDDDETEMERDMKVRSNLSKWAIQHQISHLALKDLMKLINTDIAKMLPDDPRTLLQTPQEVITTKIGADGQYWHHGFKKCLECTFRNLSESMTISVNINMDGLPIYNSSKAQFWPILFNITEMTELSPMVIGIYCGTSKCSDLQSFLTPFVDEMKEAMTHGITINSHKITVQLRCFICDSPARAYVKGRGGRIYIFKEYSNFGNLNYMAINFRNFLQEWRAITGNMDVRNALQLGSIVMSATRMYFPERSAKSAQMPNSDKDCMEDTTNTILHSCNWTLTWWNNFQWAIHCISSTLA